MEHCLRLLQVQPGLGEGIVEHQGKAQEEKIPPEGFQQVLEQPEDVGKGIPVLLWLRV